MERIPKAEQRMTHKSFPFREKGKLSELSNRGFGMQKAELGMGRFPMGLEGWSRARPYNTLRSMLGKNKIHLRRISPLILKLS